MSDKEPPARVVSEAELRARYPAPGELRRKTVLNRLDKHCRNFIAHAPFLVLATADAEGNVDASPKGDAPGFVRVLDDRTMLIPDRRGNNRLDSMSNIVGNPNVGLIFFIPGIGETLRVNGRAEIVTNPDLLADMAVSGKAPTAALRVEVREAYLHCAKALIRSRLWDGDTHLDRTDFPTLGRMLADQMAEDADVAATEARVEEGYRTRLY